MYCGSCGANNQDGAAFCEVCGAKLVNSTESSSNGGVSVAKPPIDKKKIVIIAAVVVVIAIIAIIANKISKTVNLNNYLEVEYTGYNGYGHVSYDFDEDKFKSDYGDKIKFSNSSLNSESWFSPTETIYYAIDGSFDNTSNLSNGDKVTFSWDVEENVLEACNLTFKYNDKEFTVEGLEDVPSTDPFSYIDVEFEGVSPDGHANIVLSETSDGTFSPYDFSIDKSSGLAEGDTVTVTLYYTEDECISMYGVAPTETSKEYTVSGLAAYLTTADDIPADTLEAMVQQGNDAIVAGSANWGSNYTLNSASYIGNYFATAKFADRSTQNELYLIYKITANYVSDYDNVVTQYYYAIKYSNLMKDTDGVVEVDLSNYNKVYDWDGVKFEYEYSWGTTNGYYDGYATLSDFEADVMTALTENYTYSKNITEE